MQKMGTERSESERLGFHTLQIRAGRSPNFWTRGLASPGLVVTRGLASPIEEDLSFDESGESFEVDSDSRVRPGPTSPRTALLQLHSSEKLTTRQWNFSLESSVRIFPF